MATATGRESAGRCKTFSVPYFTQLVFVYHPREGLSSELGVLPGGCWCSRIGQPDIPTGAKIVWGTYFRKHGTSRV